MGASDEISKFGTWEGWLTDINDVNRYVEIDFWALPGQEEEKPIFDKIGNMIDPGDPYQPPEVDDLVIHENNVDVSNQFEYNWNNLLL